MLIGIVWGWTGVFVELDGRRVCKELVDAYWDCMGVDGGLRCAGREACF